MVDDDFPNKPRFGAKSEFVRSLDPSIPAGQVVVLAEKQGMKLTTGFVYNIRSGDNGKSNGRNKPKLDARPGSPEAMLRVAIAEVGLARARQILEEVEATFAGYR